MGGSLEYTLVSGVRIFGVDLKGWEGGNGLSFREPRTPGGPGGVGIV